MLLTSYNKPASQQGSLRIEQVIAPARGAACSNMDWHRYFEYKKDGVLVWKVRPPSDFSSIKSSKTWNTRYSGCVAGMTTAGCNGAWRYRSVMLSDRMYRIHRIIWEMHHGPIPEGLFVDHKDGDSLNNRLSNLRLATPSQNACNRGRQRDNKSGLKGVYWDARAGGWVAQVRVNNRQYYLGCFDDKNEAHSTYAEHADRLHGEFARTK